MTPHASRASVIAARACVTAAILLGFFAPPSLAGSIGHSEDETLALGGAAVRPFSLTLNGLRLDEPTLVVASEDGLFILRASLVKLGLRIPPAAVIALDGERFVRVASVPGLSVVGDLDCEELRLAAPAEAFFRTRYPRPARTGPLPLSPIVPAAFLGYDLTLAGDGKGARLGGLLDAGLSGAWGVASTTALLRPGKLGPVRLETRFLRDLPGQHLRMIVGDAETRAGEGGRSARFAGLWLGTDVTLDPTDDRAPAPLLEGDALIPSAVELLSTSGRQQVDIAAGPFQIEAPSSINGAGEVTLTVRDATGAVRQWRQSIYGGERLLRPGLIDFSLAAGFLRQGFGTRSFDYGEGFIAVHARRGLTPWLTLGGRAEASRTTMLAGGNLNLLVPRLFEVGLGGVLSNSHGEQGASWRVQAQRIGPGFSLTGSYEHSSRRYREIGFERSGEARHGLTLAGSLSLGRAGELRASYIDARLPGDTRYRLALLGYSATLAGFNVLASVRPDLGNHSDGGIFVSLSRALGPRRSATVAVERNHVTAAFQQQGGESGDPTFGVSASRWHGRSRVDGFLLARAPNGEVELAAGIGYAGFDWRASARGGLIVVDERLVATARLQEGLALVDVAGDAPVALFHEGKRLMPLAGEGRQVLLSNLQPYSANRIAIDPAMLPPEVAVDSDEAVVVPGYRQVARLSFGKSEAAPPRTVLLADEAGRPLPPGLAVMMDGANIGPTGNGGEVFLPVGTAGGRLLILGATLRCAADLRPDTEAPIRCIPLTSKTEPPR